MYSVLIVDDERDIRNGLAAHLPWREWGFQSVYTADDGTAALELIARHPIDLIVTDIRMTRMSGLDMLSLLNRDGFDGHIIIVSGFDDFQYAKEAIRLGVDDYLLKPIDKDDLKRAVQSIAERLDKKRQQLEYASSQHANYRQMLPRLREETLQELISRPYRIGQEVRLEYRLEQLDLQWLITGRLLLAVIAIDDLGALMESQTAERRETTLFSVGNILEHALFDWAWKKAVLFGSKQGQWVCIWGQEEESEVPQLEKLVLEMNDCVRRYVKIQTSGKVTPGTTTIDHLYDTCKETEEALAFLKANRGLMEEFAEPGGELLLADIRYVSELLRYGTDEDIRDAVEDYPRLVQSWGVRHPGDLQQKSFEWLLDVFRAAQRAGWKEQHWDINLIALWEHFSGFDTVESLQEQTAVQLLRVSNSMRQQFIPQNQIVSEAKRYIREHFCETITLQTVAEHVHVSPAWLSKLFKKETNKNFLEYVTDARLDKAKELLQDLNLKVYHISSQVGYQDTIHFSRLFKRKFGLTPQEFRNSRISSND